MKSKKQILILIFMLVSGCMMGQNNTIDQDKTIRKGKLSNGLTD